jgi:hypothetical protein
LLYFLGVFLRTVRWRFIMDPIRRLPIRRLFSLQLIGYMANDILPARIGEFVRAYIMGEKEGVSKTSILATIVMERLFDGLALLFLLLVVAAVFGLVPSLQTFLVVMSVIFAVLVAIFGFVGASRRRSTAIVSLALRLVPQKLRPTIAGLVDSFINGLVAMQSPMRLLLVFIFSTAAWIVESTMAYILVFSFPFRQPFHALVAMTSVANLGTAIPSAPGGIGTFDALVKESLIIFGTNVDAAAAFAILFHVALWLPVTAVGLVLLWFENFSLAQISAQGIGTGGQGPGVGDQGSGTVGEVSHGGSLASDPQPPAPDP